MEGSLSAISQQPLSSSIPGFFQMVKPAVCHLLPDFRVLLQFMQPSRNEGSESIDKMPGICCQLRKQWEDCRTRQLASTRKEAELVPKVSAHAKWRSFLVSVENLGNRVLSEITQSKEAVVPSARTMDQCSRTPTVGKNAGELDG